MNKSMQYKSEIRTASLGGRQIRVEHLTPVLSPKERAERKRDIENCLYNVFVKYADKPDKQRQSAT